jgi:hypothetical protein
MCIVAAGPVGKDRRIKHLSTTGTFPGIKGTDEVIKLLSEHTTLAAWTLHGNPPDDEIALTLSNQSGYFTIRAKICPREKLK